ncbi:uncharacterized protein [Porites lutea]|uniref:uncharacterized protein n=1 Tax=Porites lutea TaxID=51062 RepID=UPI003CC591E7
MADGNSYSGDEYSEEDEEGEELDPRVQDELEKLNVAAESVNHLEAELDEARAVFRQTMTAATYHLNAQTKKLGNKNIEKARPFYDVLRELRKAHVKLQQATLQYEKANSRHIYARQRVQEAENRVFLSGEKRAFDTALQEMLNQATIEVNEAENQKKESWLTHQKMYKSYQETEKKAKEMQSKLKKFVEKAKPYFVEKVGFDRHLWQLKLRVDSIQRGLSEAKLIYSNCLRSLETISDDIHQKRKDKKMSAMIANLQEREAGVGADSEDEMSLDQSQLDLDLDCNASLSEVQGILPGDLPETAHILEGGGTKVPSGTETSSVCGDDVAVRLKNMSVDSGSINIVDRQISGAESSDSDFASGSFKREVYGCEEDENAAGECSGEGMKRKETEQNEVVTNDGVPLEKSEPKSVDKASVNSYDDSLYLSELEARGSTRQLHKIKMDDAGDTSVDKIDVVVKTREDVEQHCVNSLEDSTCISQSVPEARDNSLEQLEIAVEEFTNAVTVQKSDAVDDFDGKLGPFAGTESTQELTGSDNNATDDDVISPQSGPRDVTESTETEALENEEWI